MKPAGKWARAYSGCTRSVALASVPGELGRHRALCGDSLVDGTSEQVLGCHLADMTFCDLPYNVNVFQKRGGTRITNDNFGAQFPEFLQKACTQILAATKGAVYIAMWCAEGIHSR